MTKSICVIGAGPSGLVAIKSCLEANLEVICYEQLDQIGGRWNYSDEDLPHRPSVARSTVANASKEISAFSDFPPSPRYPNYMHHSQILSYCREYADRFGLVEKIQLKHRVIKCEKNDDYMETGRWKVTLKNLDNDQELTRIYDGVMVCNGHQTKPSIPFIKGQEKYKGRIIHSHSYKTPIDFNNQNVLVCGFGNSAADLVVELSYICKNVYHSFRRGSWLLSRMGTNGQPFDCEFLKRSTALIQKYCPFNLSAWFLESVFNFRFNHEFYGLKPSHRATEQRAIVNDCYASRLLCGRIIAKSEIKEFTQDGVIFHDDPLPVKCDAVIFATGYEIDFPFLDKSIVWSEANEVFLYKHVFSPKLEIPQTLGFIGLVDPYGPVVPIAELQSRWFAALNTGQCYLPTSTTMLQDIRKKILTVKEQLNERFTNGIQTDYLQIMDEIADLLGVKPDLKHFIRNDPTFWIRLMFGPLLPYQYRLSGPHAWSGARRAIMDCNNRIKEPFNTRKLDKGAKDEPFQFIVRQIVSFYMLFLLLIISFGSVISIFEII